MFSPWATVWLRCTFPWDKKGSLYSADDLNELCSNTTHHWSCRNSAARQDFQFMCSKHWSNSVCLIALLFKLRQIFSDSERYISINAFNITIFASSYFKILPLFFCLEYCRIYLIFFLLPHVLILIHFDYESSQIIITF